MVQPVHNQRERWSRPSVANGLISHRSSITAADKLAVPGTITRAAVTESGSTLANSAYNMAAAAYNRWGSSGPGTKPSSLTPTANQAINMAFAQVTGADGYDLFLSTDANPKWVGRITEAQRAAGGFIISTVGTVTAGGSAAAGSVDIGIPGTGLDCTVNPFATNNAVRPDNVTPLDTRNREYIDLLVQLTITDLRSLPSLVLTGYQRNDSSTSNWHQFWTQTVSILTAVQQPLEQMFRVTVGGAANVVFLVDSIAGQGASVDLWVDLE